MNIKPIDFLEARASVNYLTSVFDINLDDNMYNFHIYNLALQLSLISGRPEKTIINMAEQDNFLNIMKNYKDTYWQIIEDSKR